MLTDKHLVHIKQDLQLIIDHIPFFRNKTQYKESKAHLKYLKVFIIMEI